MANRSKQKGTAWETEVVEYLRALPGVGEHVERRTLAGQFDRGDIAGLPGVVIECKSVQTITLASIVDEATVEGANAGAWLPVAWIKRKGHTSAGKGYVVLEGETFARLLQVLRKAGTL